MPTRLLAALPALAVIAVLIGSVNLMWFIGASAQIGGDALNGYAADGRYFVAAHGTITEVSRSTWEWSRAHAISLFVTHPLAMLGMAYVVWRLLVLLRSNGAS